METPKYISNIQTFVLRIAAFQKQGTCRLLSTDCLMGPTAYRWRYHGWVLQHLDLHQILNPKSMLNPSQNHYYKYQYEHVNFLGFRNPKLNRILKPWPRAFLQETIRFQLETPSQTSLTEGTTEGSVKMAAAAAQSWHLGDGTHGTGW